MHLDMISIILTIGNKQVQLSGDYLLVSHMRTDQKNTRVRNVLNKPHVLVSFCIIRAA